ncbi:MAG: PLP-dependent transferase [Thermoflexales bacterium]|nr:PLP-dependent transferase [Thermoflexales bacterium]
MPHALNTRLVHTGEHQPTAQGYTPTALPVHASATFYYPDLDALTGAFERGGDAVTYARHGNPSTHALETLIADVEGGRGAVVTGSGMAALHLALLAAGTPRGNLEPAPRHILVSNDLYGTTHKQLKVFFAAQGVRVSTCDMTDLAATRQAIEAGEPDVLLCEAISNPLLKVVDLAALAELAHAVDARLVVDATMATPVLCQPLALGVDLVVHSATKYFSGHGDALGGALAARATLLSDTARRYGILLGTVLSPFEAKLIMRGMKTLALRVREQCATALTLAHALGAHPQVAEVVYPGLPGHPQHALAARQFGGLFGGILAVRLRADTRAAAAAVMSRLRIVLPATSLGDVYSLVTYPPVSSHRDVSPAERAAQGISEGLLRFSIGIEDAADLLADLTQALDGAAC